MGKFVRGDIVVINFPFSDLSGSKRRPALVLADLDGDDVILCQITSAAKTDRYGVPLSQDDCEDGALSVDSVIRPNKVFTADKNSIRYRACEANAQKTAEAINVLVALLNQ